MEINEDPSVLPGEVTAEKLSQKLAKPVLTCKRKKQTDQQAETSEMTDTTQTEGNLLTKLSSSVPTNTPNI